MIAMKTNEMKMISIIESFSDLKTFKPMFTFKTCVSVMTTEKRIQCSIDGKEVVFVCNQWLSSYGGQPTSSQWYRTE